MNLAVVIIGTDPCLQFAAKELARYLKMASGTPVKFIKPQAKLRKPTAIVELGVAKDLGVKMPDGIGDDDWFQIAPKGTGYQLTGSNPRSVLFAVYRYLRELGFRWIRPGKRGEVAPAKKVNAIAKRLKVSERASYRYRTICIEGASSQEHVTDLIDWMAKNFMNGYFIQFDYGTYFFKRWYEHRGNPFWKGEAVTPERVKAMVAKIEQEIAKRGMRFERMGHGWTCAALGLPTETGWDKDEKAVPTDKIDWLAEVNGKRELWNGISLNTNLNYGNAAVREAMTDAIVNYAKAHPQVDLLHFWLADDSNNHDERPESTVMRPSDFYVAMLNRLDEKLSAADLKTRIVFLVYVDLLWAPEKSRIRNPKRFTLMFAPITRSYRSSFFAPSKSDETVTPFVRNKLKMPKSPAVNLAYLRDWQKQFGGDGFDFDYHLIWACYYDLNHLTLAKVLYDDLRNLDKAGLHGFNSCQNTRMSYPHNLLMDIMARTLWNKRTPLAQIVKESFADAFGRDGKAVAKAFTTMSALWEPFFEPCLRVPDAKQRCAKGLKNLVAIAKQAERLRSLTERNLKRTDGAVRWSWSYLDNYLDLLEILLPAFTAYLQRDAKALALFKKANDFNFRHERQMHEVLDASSMANIVGQRIWDLETALKEAETAAKN